MSISTEPLPGTTRDPLYPDTDGLPMAESELHFLAIKYLYGALSYWFRSREDVHVAANMLLYYEQGSPAKNRGPDVMVSKGVRGKHRRRSFRTWEEGVVPAVIIEIASIGTQREDEIVKPHVYAGIGVKEYFMFDPAGEYLQPRLRGFRLENEEYELMPADEAGGIFSAELGLRLVVDDELLRLVDPATGAAIPTEEESAEQLDEALRRAEEAQREAEQAKSEAEQAKSEVEQAKSEVEQAQRKAEAERKRAAMLEAEVTRLRASLPSDSTRE
ncbi:MAG TPA: Uma2 family endonuclease [Pirellulales bacterium]|nr:Uma2 family endonuclease [Pirellulales bacterium]